MDVALRPVAGVAKPLDDQRCALSWNASRLRGNDGQEEALA